MSSSYVKLSRNENQARGIGQYAIDFVAGRLGSPSAAVVHRVEECHFDSVACAVAALATGMNAASILRQEALEYVAPRAVTCFGSRKLVAPEKAVAANCSSVRELDANGTNFGYN